MNDDEIINLFLKRDENGIIELSTKYHPYCYKIAWNLLANREDAEECLNDTWFSVWSQIPPTHPPVLAHFCGRITRNLSIDRLRKKFAGKRPDVHMADVIEEMDIRGRDLISGLPKTATITSDEILKAISDPIHEIVDTIRQTLESTPPELAADVMDTGITLTGGGALLEGLDRLIAEETGMPVTVAKDPLNCVVNGTGIVLENIDRLKTVLISPRKPKF